MKELLSKSELDCIRFYMGDPEIVNRGDFKGGPSAYNTINALLHSGIQNELDKIYEGRVIEIEDTNHLKCYINLMIHIYYAMMKYQQTRDNQNLVTYRIDRYSTIETMKKGVIEGFFSTCKYGYLEEYAHIKSNVVLLEIIRDKNVPYLDFEEIFQEYYAKPQEAEILLPYHLSVHSIEEVGLTSEECSRYYDIHGCKPIGKYRVYLKENIENSYHYDIYDWITSKSTVSRVKKCLHELNDVQCLCEDDFNFYTKWKESLLQYVLYKVSQLKHLL